MKNIKIIKHLMLAFTLINLLSCKKYLEEKSDTALIVPTTITDFQALLDKSQTMNMFTPSYGDASSDDYFILPSRYTSIDERSQKTYTWKPFDYNYSNDWNLSYLAIYYANLSLEGIEKIPVTSANQSAWNNIKGSALFYRSYRFLNMVWVYSKAYDEATFSSDYGIPLQLSSDPNSHSSRASVSDSYNQIIKDAKDALNYLPSLSANVYRPSKTACYGLLARAYLSMRKYPEALKYADSCLQLQNYIMNYNGDPGVINLALSSFSCFKPYRFNGEIIFYSQANQDINILYQFSNGKIDTTLYGSYDNNDWRKTGFAYPLGGYFTFKGSYSGSASAYFTGIATDEMYLIRAESYARTGDKTNALSDLNTLLRKRWKTGTFTDVTAIDATDALNKILLERRKELLYRCLRWIDIKRLNKEGRNIVPTRKLPDGTIVTLQPNANFYALPLPKDIIELTGIPQNPN